MWKNPTSIHSKNSQQSIREKLPQLVKECMQKPASNIRLKCFLNQEESKYAPSHDSQSRVHGIPRLGRRK